MDDPRIPKIAEKECPGINDKTSKTLHDRANEEGKRIIDEKAKKKALIEGLTVGGCLLILLLLILLGLYSSGLLRCRCYENTMRGHWIVSCKKCLCCSGFRSRYNSPGHESSATVFTFQNAPISASSREMD